MQAHLAEAEAILNAARAYVIDALGALWETICDGAADPSINLAQARLAIVHWDGANFVVRDIVNNGTPGVTQFEHVTFAPF